MKLRVLLAFVVIIAAAALGGCLFPQAPQAAFTYTPSEGYPPFTVQFDAGTSSSPNGSIVSYTWDFGDGTTGVGITTEHTFAQPGMYPVRLTVTDSAGKTGTVTHTVHAINRPPHAAFTYWPYMVGKGDPVSFDASESTDPDGEIVEYQWNFGDGTTASDEYVAHAYASAGSNGIQYPVTLTVTDNNGASASITKYVQVVGCGSCGG